MKKLLVSLGIIVLVLGVASDAEARRGAKPYSLQQDAVDFSGVAHHVLPTPDLQKIFLKDMEESGKMTRRLRVAETIPAGVRMSEIAAWQELPDGSHLWRGRFSSWGAYFLSFDLSEFELPRWGTMHFISVDRDYYDGPYTSRNNSDHRTFGSPMVPGDSAVVEVRIPAGAPLPDFTFDNVYWGYRNFRNILAVPFRDGRPVMIPEKAIGVPFKGCEVDVNCPEGDAWQEEKRAVAQPYDGNFICSGAAINSTDDTCTEYHFLTAAHCFGSGKAKRLRFYWNYENSCCGCSDAPIDQVTIGSVYLGGDSGSDTYLVRLTEIPPENWYVALAGFDATGAIPQSGTTIHHPMDLPKKISHEYHALTIGGPGGWGDDHWRINHWEVGTTEPGSSGSNLWDQNHRSVGVLTGGTAVCGEGWDEYGMLAVAWTNGLDQHLDPGSTGQMQTDLIRCFTGEPPPPPPPCELGMPGDPCTSDADCCSNKCKGKPGAKTCA